MTEGLDREKPVVRLRAFRAIDEPETCKLFIEGHAHVLTSIGITKVTSSRDDWMFNPGAFVLVVESPDRERVYGGARVHVAGGSEPLPVEQATYTLDPGISELVGKYARHGTGEICGLWNSQELAGYGIGNPLLIRAGIAISSQLNISSLLALCAPYTVNAVKNCGMVLEDSVGNKGTFYYPKLDLVATVMVLEDVNSLKLAETEDKEEILRLRERLDDYQIFELKQRQITIDFKLKIQNMERWNIDDFIDAAVNNRFSAPITGDNTPFL